MFKIEKCRVKTYQTICKPLLDNRVDILKFLRNFLEFLKDQKHLVHNSVSHHVSVISTTRTI